MASKRPYPIEWGSSSSSSAHRARIEQPEDDPSEVGFARGRVAQGIYRSHGHGHPRQEEEELEGVMEDCVDEDMDSPQDEVI